MNNAESITDERLAQIREYINSGLKLCLISPGKKSPVGTGWNREENALTVDAIVPPGYGVGLMHACSGTCALDVDDLERATGWLAERGVDLPALLNASDAVQIVSGNPNRAKLVYALPSWASMPSKKIIENGHVILEFRCATANGLSVQDVLPPSLHPATGQPYRWAGGGDWHALATLPEALVMLWHALLVEDTRHSMHASNGEHGRDVSWAEVTSALYSITAECPREQWRNIGYALQSTGHASAFDLWNEWSAQSTGRGEGNHEYKPHEMAAQWRSFKDPEHLENPIRIGTLFGYALANGWQWPAPDVSELFTPGAQQSSQPAQQSSQSSQPAGQSKQSQPAEHPVHAPDVEQSEDMTPFDPMAKTYVVPPYVWGQLPVVYEKFIEANFRFHTGASIEPYAGMFSASVANNARPSVRVEPKPRSGRNGGRMMSLNEHAAIIGASGRGKSETMFHVLDHEVEQSGIRAWKNAERYAAQTDLEQKLKIRAAQLAAQIEPKLTKAEIKSAVKKFRDAHPTPCIDQDAVTDTALIDSMAMNLFYDLPTDLIVDEWANVFGGSAYKNDGGKSIRTLSRRTYDNQSGKRNTSGGGEIEVIRLSGNLTYTCVPGDLSAWREYEEAIIDGTFPRQSVFAPGPVFEGVRDKVLDHAAIGEWRLIQRRLRDIHKLNMFLDDDPEFDAFVEGQLTQWRNQAANGHPLHGWLTKMEIRCARLAAELYLVDALSTPGHRACPCAVAEACKPWEPGKEGTQGTRPSEFIELVIPKEYRHRAWAFLTTFVWPHQVFVHYALVPGSMYEKEAMRLLSRIHENRSKTWFSSDELIGSKAPRSVKGNLDFIKLLMYGYKWFEPVDAGRKKYDRTRPETAFNFRVNPLVYSICDKHSDFLSGVYETNTAGLHQFKKKKDD